MRTKTMLLAAVGCLTMVGHSATVTAEGLAYGRSQAPAPLEGTWVVTIRPIFCSGPSAGEDVPGVTPVKSHMTFGRGGTLIEESSGNANVRPDKRTGGNGWWDRTGRTSYQFALQAFLVSPDAPYLSGIQRFDQTLELHTSDEWTSTGQVRFFETFDLNDTPDLAPYRAGCARVHGARMY